MEAEFKELLEGIQPTPLLLKLFKAMFTDAYDKHIAQAQDRLKAFRQESIDLEKQIARVACGARYGRFKADFNCCC